MECSSLFVYSQSQLKRVVNKPRHTSIQKTITTQFPQRKVFHRDSSGRQRAEVLYVGAKLITIVRSGISYQAGYEHNVYNNMQQFKGSGDGKQIFSSLSVSRRGQNAGGVRHVLSTLAQTGPEAQAACCTMGTGVPSRA